MRAGWFSIGRPIGSPMSVTNSGEWSTQSRHSQDHDSFLSIHFRPPLRRLSIATQLDRWHYSTLVRPSTHPPPSIIGRTRKPAQFCDKLAIRGVTR